MGSSIFGSGGSGTSSAGGLVRRATTGGNAKRWSLGGSGSNSPLAALEDSVFGTSMNVPSTPTPSGGTGAQRGVSVGLNNKWLYKRQHGSPGQGKYI
jgi:hypothetical protein